MASNFSGGTFLLIQLCPNVKLLLLVYSLNTKSVGMIGRNSQFSTAKNPFILQYDNDTKIVFTYLSGFSMNQRTVLMYELITKKS